MWGPVIFNVRSFDNETARLCWLQVLNDYARQGWASRFMRELEAWADSHPVTLTLEVFPQGIPKIPKTKLRAFYRRHGFVADRFNGENQMKRIPR
jgi:GNAT superfamily N-acetyltransferase